MSNHVITRFKEISTNGLMIIVPNKTDLTICRTIDSYLMRKTNWVYFKGQPRSLQMTLITACSTILSIADFHYLLLSKYSDWRASLNISTMISRPSALVFFCILAIRYSSNSVPSSLVRTSRFSKIGEGLGIVVLGRLSNDGFWLLCQLFAFHDPSSGGFAFFKHPGWQLEPDHLVEGSCSIFVDFGRFTQWCFLEPQRVGHGLAQNALDVLQRGGHIRPRTVCPTWASVTHIYYMYTTRFRRLFLWFSVYTPFEVSRQL